MLLLCAVFDFDEDALLVGASLFLELVEGAGRKHAAKASA